MIDERLAVVTVAFDSDTELNSLLTSVSASTVRPAAIVVADNAPQLGDARRIAERFGAALVANPDNPGYGAAINRACATLPSQIEFVLVANPDVVLGVDALEQLRDTLAASPGVGAVGPGILNADGERYPSARSIPQLSTGIGHALFHRVWPANPWTARYHQNNERAEERSAGWLSGACVLLRRRAFDSVGGFDDGYFMYFEDVDLGYRMGLAGWENRYLPGAIVTHTGAHSTRSRAHAMTRAHHESAERFLQRRYPRAWQAPVRVLTALGLRVRSRLLT